MAQALWRSQNIGTQSINENYTSSSTKLYVTSDTELLKELNTQNAVDVVRIGKDFSVECGCI